MLKTIKQAVCLKVLIFCLYSYYKHIILNSSTIRKLKLQACVLIDCQINIIEYNYIQSFLKVAIMCFRTKIFVLPCE